MAKRESSKKEAIVKLIPQVCGYICQMQDGDKETMLRIVNAIYDSQRYELQHLGMHIGHAWTRDSGKTYILAAWDLIEVLDLTGECLKDTVKLDFSEYDGMIVGLPYNLDFTVRKVN